MSELVFQEKASHSRLRRKSPSLVCRQACNSGLYGRLNPEKRTATPLCRIHWRCAKTPSCTLSHHSSSPACHSPVYRLVAEIYPAGKSMQTMQNQQSPQKNGYGSGIATTQVDIAAAHLSHDLSGANRSPLVSETPLAAQKPRLAC